MIARLGGGRGCNCARCDGKKMGVGESHEKRFAKRGASEGLAARKVSGGPFRLGAGKGAACVRATGESRRVQLTAVTQQAWRTGLDIMGGAKCNFSRYLLPFQTRLCIPRWRFERVGSRPTRVESKPTHFGQGERRGEFENLPICLGKGNCAQSVSFETRYAILTA
jgi:hypothetical protein